MTKSVDIYPTERQATLMNKVCKVAEWLSGPYHLGEDLPGPQGYICLKRAAPCRHVKAVPMLKVDRFRGKKSKDNSRTNMRNPSPFFLVVFLGRLAEGLCLNVSMSPED